MGLGLADAKCIPTISRKQCTGLVTSIGPSLRTASTEGSLPPLTTCPVELVSRSPACQPAVVPSSWSWTRAAGTASSLASLPSTRLTMSGSKQATLHASGCPQIRPSVMARTKWMQAEAHWYLRQNHLPPMAEGQQVEDPPMLVGQELALLRHPLGHHQVDAACPTSIPGGQSMGPVDGTGPRPRTWSMRGSSQPPTSTHVGPVLRLRVAPLAMRSMSW